MTARLVLNDSADRLRETTPKARELRQTEPGDHSFDAKQRSGAHPEHQSDTQQGEDRALLTMRRCHGQHEADGGGDPEPAQPSVHDLLAAKSVAAQFARPPHDWWAKQSDPGAHERRKTTNHANGRLDITATNGGEIFGAPTRSVRSAISNAAVLFLWLAHVECAVEVVEADQGHHRTFIGAHVLAIGHQPYIGNFDRPVD